MHLRASSASLTLAVVALTPVLATAGDLGARLSKWFVMQQPHAVAANVEAISSVLVPIPAAQFHSGLDDLRNCGAQGSVSLMTILNFRRSTISLQAGKHGEPMLRWSSRDMNRGEARRGLLDGMRGPASLDDVYRR